MWKRSTCFTFLIVLLALIQGSAFGAFNPLDDPALVGWWACDEGEGSLVADSSANGNDGTAVEGDLIWGPGVYGNAIELTGGLVEIPAVNITMTESTMAGWIKPMGAQPAWASILMTRGSATGLNLNPDTGDLQLAYHWGDAAGSWGYRPGLYLADSEWNFTAVTVTANEAVFYLNGEETATNAAAHGSVDWSANIYIGGDGSGSFAARRVSDAWFDDVSLWTRALTADEIETIMGGLFDPTLASAPSPADGASDVPRDTVLSWSAGETAATHDVYFGMSFEDVNAASRANPMDVLLSQGQAGTTYDPGRLEFSQTYYWRIDEVEAGGTIYKGDVWTFEVEPFAYAVPNIIATSNGVSDAVSVPERTVDGSGLNADDQHSVESADMWLASATTDGAPLYIQYEFDGVYKLHELQVWNYNVMFELMLGFGVKNVTVEYSTDGVEWTALGDFDLTQATAKATYVYNSTIDFQGLPAKYVKLTVNSGFGMLGQFGLSEVRFMHIPVQAREPEPADDATNVDTEIVLSWRAGREAGSHEVYLGTDAEALPLLDVVSEASVTSGTLDLATTYSWKIVEVNDVEAITSWEGNVWSFTTRPFTPVDDFESYDDDIEAMTTIFDTWIDGWVNGTGSTVGYMTAPFAEQTIVNSGQQSMPLSYDNAGVSTAEAVRTFDSAQDWTVSAVKTLAVSFYGTQGNDGQLYLKINDTKVSYNGDAIDIALGQWQQWLIDLSTVGGNLQSVTEMTIGIEGSGASGMLYIDDIRLYPDEIEMITPVDPDPAGLLVSYSFEEGSGTSVADASGNGNTGTIDGNPGWVAGYSGTALSFDGSRDYITTGASLLNDLPQFTIACWLKGDLSLGNRSGLIGQNDCAEYGVVSANTLQIWTAGGGSVDLTWPYDAAADWHHIVAVGDGTSITFYLDGKPAASGGAVTESYGSSTYMVNIGGGGIFDATDNWFTGQIDEVRIYGRALSAAEVAGLAGRTASLPKPL